RLLALHRVAVHLLAADLLALGDVLRRLAHGDVDVRVFLGVARDQLGVEAVGRVGVAASVAGDALDARADEDVALAGLDRVGGDARRHQRGRAVAVDRAAGHVEASQDADDAADVVALLTPGQTAAADHVLDLRPIELGHLVDHLAQHESAEVVGTDVDERTLARPADRRTTVGDDHSFSHE